MKLTSFTDYSLRILMYLAVDAARRVTVADIAAAYGISENHLVKIAHFMGKQGWLETVRGKGGGIRLAMAPAELNIGRVVRATEGVAIAAECFAPDGGHCLIVDCCDLKAVLGEAVSAFYAVLDRHTLADLVRDRRGLADALMRRAA
ncbi:MAG: Rrf2 family transcriptional regulator [Burkholderiales bacterium]|nr:Rrf2 family transcriptional regulator [Burkholderiales bacterium]MDE2456288.1 Rrf2 family transcriptional regulator [Burkholderiales bacterium]